MYTYRITTSLGDEILTQYRNRACDEYCALVKKSYAMHGRMSGESVALYKNGARILEHFGRKYLAEQVEARLVALDSAPANDNPLDL